MAYETLTDRRMTRMGRYAVMKGRVTPTAATGNIDTGLTLVLYARMTPINTAVVDVSIAKNTESGTDNDMTKKGTIYFGAAGVGADTNQYQLTAWGMA